MNLIPTPYCGVLARRHLMGADCHGNDIYETVSETIPLVGVTETSDVREDADGTTYTCTAKIHVPRHIKDIKPYDVITVDGEHVYLVREYPKFYHSPWPTSPLGRVAPQVVYAVRQTT